MTFVRAAATFATHLNGWPQVISAGEVFEDDDPIVVAHPSCFEPMRATNPRPVEQATAGPGEFRNVRRPR
jgi:hypothetical protein